MAQLTIAGPEKYVPVEAQAKDIDTNFTEVYADIATNLASIGNLVIGTDVQAWSAVLDTYAGIDPSANIQSFLAAADYAAARIALGLEIGADVQAYSAKTVLSHRQRTTVTEINAGVEILPAITGKAYRLISCKAVAYGGAVGAVTTVDLLGDQSGSVKLVAFAQAALTQSTVLTDGDTNSAVLADGASYVANDVTTAITVLKTGSDATTATGVDFIIEYVIE